MDESQRLRQLQSHFPNQVLDPSRMRRFLRARNGDVRASAAMLRADIEWRETNTIPPPISHFEARLCLRKAQFIGVSKAGMPVALVHIGRHANDEPVAENIALAIFMLEYAIQSMQPGIEMLMVLIDFDGFSLRCIDYAFLRQAISILQNNYPERLGLVCLLDAPFVCQAAWRVIRPWLDDKTREKVIFLNGQQGRGVLLELIDASVLPTKYGGKSPYNPDEDTAHPFGVIQHPPKQELNG